MKSAKGEAMDANMPAVRFKINQPRVSLWTAICPRYDETMNNIYKIMVGTSNNQDAKTKTMKKPHKSAF